MDTNLKALKDLYVSMGGAESDVDDLTASSEVIPLIKNVAGGGGGISVVATYVGYLNAATTIGTQPTSLFPSSFLYYDQEENELEWSDIENNVSFDFCLMNFFSIRDLEAAKKLKLVHLGASLGMPAISLVSPDASYTIAQNQIEFELILFKNS